QKAASSLTLQQCPNAPLGRPGQPVEIAPLYVTLAAEENSYTSGQVWCSDGGTGTL
ncbi:TPA: SDR family oxidoreductase, partial [Klebsiella oxytoca]|nr:SDR family oxidoreductase [Klebsiella oxytoca]